MDVAAVNDKSAASVSRCTRQLSSASTLLFAIAFSCAFDSQARSQVVEAALEPTLASHESPSPSNPIQQQIDSNRVEAEPSKQDKKEEPNRKSEVKKKVQSFIPPQRPIGQVSIDLRPKPKNGSTVIPENLTDSATPTAEVYASTSEEMQGELFYTKSRNHDELFAYQPLYFEEVNLERYGRTCGHLQPAVSGLRFFATIPLLPYAMTANHPSTTYTRKWPYEAGWGAPRVKELEPLQLKPSLVQAGALTGLVFVLP